ncbi:GNAT family N-acetyltransferase [Paremcibacter congregatus]|uniref:GNAT family N-acetyltransferase n=1 Tax=Paremcibacter congregatus TaxID=2043170 RepID=UPI003A8DC5E7
MNKNQIEVRPVGAHEIQDLHLLAKRTFLEAFSLQNTPEDMAAYSEQAFCYGAIEAEFLNPDSTFFFAACSTKIIGYLKLNRGAAQTEHKLENALEIERIYITAEFQGGGVGQALLQKAFDISRQDNYDWLWLGVWEQNPGAIRFYQRHGFVAFDSHAFLLGDDPQTDLLMRKKIHTQS